MSEIHQRTELLIGNAAVKKLEKSHVLIFGIGGVGGSAAEAIARAGVGKITLVDSDKVSESNINRQIVALKTTIGQPKVLVMKKRIEEINPEICVCVQEKFCLPDNIDEFFTEKVDYVVDAVDTVAAKLAIAKKCKAENIPEISAMGAGNKLNPQEFRVADIFSTRVCPLCRVMRRELKKRNIKELKVVYSEEEPIKHKQTGGKDMEKLPPGSVSFVPPVMGFIIAGEVIKDIIKEK